MTFLIIAGAIAFVIGIIFILFPTLLSNAASVTNKIVANVDALTLKYRLGIGISLMLTGACLWFIAYYMNVIPILRNL